MNDTTDAVGALAMSYIDRTLKSGRSVTIPSLGIVIEGDTMIQRWDDLTPEEQQPYLTEEELRAQLAAVTARAEAAEAALAAVPVDALRRTLLTGYRTDAQITADADAINDWLQFRA